MAPSFSTSLHLVRPVADASPLPDEPPMSGQKRPTQCGVYEDVAPEGMRVFKSVGPGGFVVEWRCLRSELVTDSVIDDMQSNLETWNQRVLRLA